MRVGGTIYFDDLRTYSSGVDSEDDRQRSRRLMATVDQLNRELGRGTVRLGLPRQGNAWQLPCNRRSPRYTTWWEELVRVRS
jgi:DNA polymerase V